MRREDDTFTTDTRVPAPWLDQADPPPAPVLHLVVACFLGEPDRVGHAARIDRACWLGRPDSEPVDEAPLRFFEVRPGRTLEPPPFASKAISRRQLQLNPLPADGSRVHVRNAGRRALFHNGVETGECVVQAGDTLMLEHTAVFVVELRPPAFGRSLFAEGVGEFAFGAGDRFGMVGESAMAWQLRAELAAAAASDGHLLLLGETGAGKEVAARVVHGLSARGRAGGPMVARNAATMPDTLLDAELFGNAKNYPNTGAPEREGLIGAAHGGHLMLDEIGELPEGHQAHLLRVLDARGEYQRLGESRARVSDFRLIAATNRDPKSLKHDFLARFPQRVTVPGLNERRSDIPLLIRELVGRLHRQTPNRLTRFVPRGAVEQVRLEPRLVDALVRHEYRLHTRELSRLLEVAVATSRSEYLSLTDEVEEELARSREGKSTSAVGSMVSSPGLTAEEVARVLVEVGGNVTHAAQRFGVSRHALHRLMKSHGIARKLE
jgi:DNA-binding NtrC family response regulator